MKRSELVELLRQLGQAEQEELILRLDEEVHNVIAAEIKNQGWEEKVHYLCNWGFHPDEILALIQIEDRTSEANYRAGYSYAAGQPD